MGEIYISGPGALQSLQNIFTNDFHNMADGHIRYTVMCDDSGGILDDMLVYRIQSDRYFIVVNAANRKSDVEWIKNRLGGAAEMTDVSEQTAQIAVQGPAAISLTTKLTGGAPSVKRTFADNLPISGIPCLVSRSGYTGEDGFEIYCDSGRAGAVWDALAETGGGYGLIPCGLGARDTLRLEAGLPLYGHEMDRSVTPFETGLGFAVKLAKTEFIGREALLARSRPVRKRAGVRITGRGIARDNCEIIREGKIIGKTTSGTYCPFLGYSAAMAFVGAGVEDGTPVEVDIRGKLVEAVIVPLPFYKRE
jgi:aminomethyltransferase